MVQKQPFLWTATMRPAPLRERIDAAAAAGFCGLSITPNDCFETGESPKVANDLRKYAEDKGINLKQIDPITQWYPFTPSSRHYTPPPLPLDSLLDRGTSLGATDTTVIAAYPTPGGMDAFAEHFALLCDRLADFGMRAALEFTPLPPVPDLATGWEIVRRADRPNGGLVFDSWHFFRGNPDFDILASIPGDRIFSVQLNDGGPIVESVIKDTYYHRLHVGEGRFELKRLIAALDAIGGLEGHIGPEVLSHAQHALPPAEAAAHAAGIYNPFIRSLQ